MKVIDKLVEKWYADMDCNQKIHDYLGLTLAEYDDFVNNGMIPDRLPELSAEYEISNK